MGRRKWPAEALNPRIQELARKRSEGTLSGVDLEELAEAAGCSVRTIRRDIARGGAPSSQPIRYRLGDRECAAFFEARGRPLLAYRKLQAEGVELPSRRTFERALRREFSPAEREYAKDGIEGRRRREIYLRHEEPHRNDLWELDSTLLDVFIVPERGHKLVRPTMFAIIDAATRAIPGYFVGFTHTADDALAALRHAILPDDELGPFGGVPQALRIDNAREFLSNQFTEALTLLGIVPRFSAPYTPQLKGKVERLHRTIGEEFVSQLHFSTKSPRGADRRYLQPNEGALSRDELNERMQRWVASYNNQRPHRTLGDRTPHEAWEADRAPILAPPDDLRWMLRRHEPRKVNKDGIRFRDETFVAAELNGLVGEPVEIHFKDDDLRQIDVYYDGDFLATARPQHALSPEDRVTLTERRRADRKHSSERKRRPSATAAAELRRLRGTQGPKRGGGRKRSLDLGDDAPGRTRDLLELDRYLPSDERDG